MPTESVMVAVGTKRPREEVRTTVTAPVSGLEAWAAQTAPTVITADLTVVASSRLETGTPPARTTGGASTSQASGFVHGEISIASTEDAPPLESRKTTTGGTHAAFTTTTSQKSSRRKIARCFRYGNYHRYYGYRVGETLEDHRVAHFRDEWFVDKRVLDVGCNEGLVGLSIAVRCRPRSVLGVDIDPHLVKKAREKLDRLKRAAAREKKELTTAEKKSTEKKKIEEEAPVNVPEEASKGPARLADAIPALSQCSFLHCNVAEAPVVEDESARKNESQKNIFEKHSLDAVLCLSVTKWIQLNWGDAGLVRVFENVFHSLAPGGVFIVEPQPWKSYRQAFKKQNMPEETKAHFREIKIRPKDYAEFLKTSIGFETVTTLRDADLHDASEFDRTVLLCVKKRA